MHEKRPPHSILVFLAVMILTLSIAELSALDEFVLPDLIFERLPRPDIAQPDNYPDPAESWLPRLPSFRRQYPFTTPAILPLTFFEASGIIDKEAESLYWDEEMSLASRKPLRAEEFRRSGILPPLRNWSIGANVNPLEALDLGLAVLIPQFGTLGANSIIPFNHSEYQSLSGEVNWTSNSRLGADVRIGYKKDLVSSPYSIGRIDWLPRFSIGDSYTMSLHHYGTSEFSALLGARVDFPIRDSRWTMLLEVDAGGWTPSDNGAKKPSASGAIARSAVATRLFLPSAHWELEGGADICYTTSRGLEGTPYLGLLWSPVQSFHFFADSRIATGYPKSVDDSMSKMRLGGFLPELPVSKQYRVGLTGTSEHLDYRLETAYSSGSFAFAEKQIIVTLPDRRLSGLAELGIAFKTISLLFSGHLDYSIAGRSNLWETRATLIADEISFFIAGGSMDAILSTGLLGMRGEKMKMGLGLEWVIRSQWNIGVSMYTGIPWSEPSINISVNWRNS